ncbi:conserved hypothetical protein [Sphingobium faniae]|nr:conserved hypothetical protein [Sphingobium faniae]
MVKLILLVKRKAGLTHEQFRAHYENTHAPLAWSVLQPHLIRYTRNFLTPLPGQPEPPYDCVTEFWFPDHAAQNACFAWTRSEEGQVLARDEENFMDRASMRTWIAEEASSHI